MFNGEVTISYHSTEYLLYLMTTASSCFCKIVVRICVRQIKSVDLCQDPEVLR